MPKGVSWDELPKWFGDPLKEKDEFENAPKKDVWDVSNREVDHKKDVTDIGKRVLFGTICGGITGATFGAIEALRDTKNLTGNSQLVKQKVTKFGGMFAGFFSLYHGTRKTLHLYVPMSPENNVMTASAVSLSPVLVFRNLRPMAPYGVLLIILDCVNGMDDI
jgi:hypothetical protein